MFQYTPDKVKRRKMESDWDYGYFMGIDPSTSEYVMIKDEGIFVCSTIRRLQEDKAFDKKILTEVKLTFREYVTDGASSAPMVVRPAGPSEPVAGPGGARALPRRARMGPKDFENFGYTVGCPGCEQIQLKMGERRGHTEECRQRIESEIAKTREGQDRLSRAKARIDHETAVIGQETVIEDKDNLQDLPEKTSEVIHESRPERAPEQRPDMEFEETRNSGGASSSNQPMPEERPSDATMRFDISSPPRARVERRRLDDEDHRTDDE